MAWRGIGEAIGRGFEHGENSLDWLVDQTGKTGERLGGFFVGSGDGGGSGNVPVPWLHAPNNGLLTQYINTPESSKPSSVASAIDNFVRHLPGGNSGSDYAAAAAAAAARAAIQRQYEELRQRLTANRDQAAGVLSGAMNDYNRNVNSNWDMYQSGAKNISDSIAARGADAQRTNQSQTDQFLRSMAALGVNGNVVAAQGQANADSLRNQNQLQSDLAARLAQVASSGHQNWMNTGALVNQGATAHLANNYNDMMAKVNAAEADALSGGSGGGSGGGRSSKVSAAEQKAAAQSQMISNALGSGSGDAMLATLAVTNPNYFNYVSGLDPQQNDIGALARAALVSAASPETQNQLYYQTFLDKVRSGKL